VREQTARTCAEIDATLGPANNVTSPKPSAPATAVPVSFTFAWNNYKLWDMFLVPVHPLLAFARDKIRLARISPDDTPFIGTPPEANSPATVLDTSAGS